MSSFDLVMPHCTCCNRAVAPGDTGVTKFACPNCGAITIIRCGRCREFGNQYTCPNCGFTGP